MAGIFSSVLERSTLRRWSKVVERLDALDPRALSTVRSRARMLSHRLDEVMHEADARLASPDANGVEVPRPLHADWAWRPEVWRGPIRPTGLAPAQNSDRLGRQTRIFHDCETSELSVRQVRNSGVASSAPFGLRFDVFRFDGSFLSVVLDLPEIAVVNLSRRHIVSVDLEIETEAPLEVFTRLNLRHGPNTETFVREVPPGSQHERVEFDLSEGPEVMGPISHAWVDVIFEGPQLNQIVMRDLTMARRPRAEL